MGKVEIEPAKLAAALVGLGFLNVTGTNEYPGGGTDTVGIVTHANLPLCTCVNNGIIAVTDHFGHVYVRRSKGMPNDSNEYQIITGATQSARLYVPHSNGCDPMRCEVCIKLHGSEAWKLFRVWMWSSYGPASDPQSKSLLRGFKLGREATGVVGDVKYDNEFGQVNLVRLSVRALGFRASRVHLKDIIECALSAGLIVCRPEIGLRLRGRYTGQMRGETLYVTARHIGETRHDQPCNLWILDNADGTLWLDIYPNYPGPDAFSLDAQFVFEVPTAPSRISEMRAARLEREQ